MDPLKTFEQQAFDVKHANEMEVAKRELMRRSHDTIRVYNPLDHTFSFMYDRFWHRVPSKGHKDMERYLAIKFFKNICDFMIGQQITKQGNELKAIREKQMGAQFLDHYEENVQVWDKVPTMNDPELMDQIRKVVIVGLVEEYGAYDEPVLGEQIPEARIDYRPVHEQMFDSIKPISQEAAEEIVTPLAADTPLPASLEELQGKSAPAEEIQPVPNKKKLEKEVLNEQD